MHLLGAPLPIPQTVTVRSKRWPILLLTGAIAAIAAATVALPTATDQLLYNRTPSVPVGFYLRADRPIARGTFVTVHARDVAPDAARARGFDGERNRFIKRVAAVAGDHVCAAGDSLTINDGPPVSRRSHDSTGAQLVRWNECRTLLEGEVLLLGDTTDSFDGRYWGPIDRTHVEGVWRPL